MILEVLAQVVPMPTDPQNPWLWVAGVAVTLLVTVTTALGGAFWHMIGDKDKQIEKLSSELAKKTDTLRTVTDVGERQRVSFTEEFSDLRSIIGELLDLIAPRRKAE